MKEDIRRLGLRSIRSWLRFIGPLTEVRPHKFVGVSDPGGVNNYDISPENRKFAHDLIDAGVRTDRPHESLGQTILMITHNPEAAAYAHRIR
jgi:hypothetical protein